MNKGSLSKKINPGNSNPDISEPQKNRSTDALLALANEYINHVGSSEQRVVIFYRIGEKLQHAKLREIETYYQYFKSLHFLDAQDKRVMVMFIKVTLAVCKIKGMGEAQQENTIVRMLIKHLVRADWMNFDEPPIREEVVVNFPEEKMLLLEYADFCLSQYSEYLIKDRNATSEGYILSHIEYSASEIVEISQCDKEVLNVYSKILSEKIKAYSTGGIQELSEKLRSLVETFSGNSIIIAAYLKSTFLYGSKLLDPGTRKALLGKTEEEFCKKNIFVDLLSNIILAEDTAGLCTFHQFLYKYMNDEKDTGILVDEYAGTIKLLNMLVKDHEIPEMMNLGSALLSLFPQNKNVVTAYGHILKRRIKSLPQVKRKSYRKEFSKLICKHPDNMEIEEILTSEVAEMDGYENLWDMLEIKQELETTLWQWVVHNDKLKKQYVRLLKKIDKLFLPYEDSEVYEEMLRSK